MELNEQEKNALRGLIHDINGQLFLIRGHCEIAKITSESEQRIKSIEQINDGANQVERLMRDLRTELGFPKGEPQQA